MSLSNKLFFLFVLLLFAGNQLYLVATQFWDTRIIEVRKEIYESNEKDYLKDYQIENAPFEKFDLRVQPKTFWDYILLTNKNGNLLSALLIIAFSGCFGWYVYRLNTANFLSPQDLKWLTSALLLIAVCYPAYIEGLFHTKDFWDSIYLKKTKGNFGKNDFFVKTEDYRFMLELGFWGLLFSIQVIREITGKPWLIKLFYKAADTSFKKITK
jgi:hypothetical protein